MKHEVEQVLGRLNSLLESDGSRLTLVEAQGDTVTVLFEQGQPGACERCAIDGDTVEMLIREAVSNHLPAVRDVTILRKN